MYIKTINEFIKDVNEHFEKNVICILKKESGKNDEDVKSEEASWKESLPALAEILKKLPENIKNACQICLEAKYIGEERADVVLVGTKAGKPTMLFIENKRWSNLKEYYAVGESSVWDPYHFANIDHPSHQVNYYASNMLNTNKYVQDNKVDVFSMVYMQNGVLAEKLNNIGPFENCFSELIKVAPIFTSDNIEVIVNHINALFDGGKEVLAQDIYNSPEQYSQEYIDALTNAVEHYDKLKKFMDPDQNALLEEIAQEVLAGSGRKKVFIIEGNPGTGKTIVALALLIYLLKFAPKDRKPTVKYILKNRAPRIFVEQKLRIVHSWMSFGIKNLPDYDCLICDESHRMQKEVYSDKKNQENSDNRDFIETFINKCRVSVFFYDSKQTVNISDYVTKEKITTEAKKQNIEVICRKLDIQHRCKDADKFLKAINQLLDEPEKGLQGIEPFTEDEKYKVALVDDPRKLFQLITELNAQTKDKTSRVVAGKGSTYNEDWNWAFSNKDYNASKTIAPLRDSNEKLYTWNFGQYDKDKTFATDPGSVKLVGCIDTSQGLEFEYVGVIIPPDLVYNEETKQIEIDLKGHQKKDGNIKGDGITTSLEDIKQVIKNTYRVLLSRGEKGCYIYCFNKELQDYLSRIFPTKQIDLDSKQPGFASGRTDIILKGKVKYVDSSNRFAYIMGDDGKEYRVSTSWMRKITFQLIKGQKVSFLKYGDNLAIQIALI